MAFAGFLFYLFLWTLLLLLHLSCSSADQFLPTNPVTTPAGTATYPPAIITVPAATTTAAPWLQSPNYYNPVTTTPPTNPVGGIPGQSWCVAKSGAPDYSLQTALDYACGPNGGVDCSSIQQGGSCYNPNSLPSHASYAFNLYYQKNPSLPARCDFAGTATITTTNPSSGSCVYPLSSGSTISSPPPVTQYPTPPSITPSIPIPIPTPTQTTPTYTPAGVPLSGLFPPMFSNITNPTTTTTGGQMPGMGDGGTPLGNTSNISISIALQPFIGSIFLVFSICIGILHLF